MMSFSMELWGFSFLAIVYAVHILHKLFSSPQGFKLLCFVMLMFNHKFSTYIQWLGADQVILSKLGTLLASWFWLRLTVFTTKFIYSMIPY